MPKWVKFILPRKSGFYLIRIKNKYYYRSDYDTNTGIFTSRAIGRVRPDPKNQLVTYENLDFEWWDEFDHLEEKVTFKLNFKTNGNS